MFYDIYIIYVEVMNYVYSSLVYNFGFSYTSKFD